MSIWDSVKAKGSAFLSGGYQEEYVEDEQFEEDYGYEEEPRYTARRMRGFEDRRDYDAQPAVSPKSVSHILLYKVKRYDDARYIGDQLKNNISVVVNYEHVDVDLRMRIHEFIYGVTFAKGGQFNAISESTVIYSVDKVDVKNSISDVKSAADYAYSQVR